MSSKPIEYERRPVKDWLLALIAGTLALPRFQRSYVWTDRKTSDLIIALLQGRPVGTMLIIDRFSDTIPKGESPDRYRHLERFAPRALAGSETELVDCYELILDGQQRLTSLWRALELGAGTGMNETEKHGKHAFLEVEDIAAAILNPITVTWPSTRQAHRLRLNAGRAYRESLIPLHLFDPRSADTTKGPSNDPLWNWCKSACNNAMDAGNDLWWRISEQVRRVLLDRNLWYAKLPRSMERSQAIEVFVKVNESSAVIRKFDIAVAEYERGTDRRSLRKEISEWAEDNAHSEAFFGPDEEKLIPRVGELILKVACLQEGKAPTDRHYTADAVIDRLRDPNKLRTIFRGIEWTFEFLGEERIWRDKYLPSAVPLRVVPAVYPELRVNCDGSDLEGKARRCVRAYLWRAFVTQRYNQAANTRLQEDYEKLKNVLLELRHTGDPLRALIRNVPIFSSSFPLPNESTLCDLKDPLAPPTRKNSLSRALLVASLHKGARDFGSGEAISAGNVGNREAHHIFPKGFIKSSVKHPQQINHCLNYALVSGPTNKRIAAKPPLAYMQDRYSHDPNLTREELERRLESHVIPYHALRVGGGASGYENPDRVGDAYQRFLRVRGKQLRRAIGELAQGRPL